MKYLPISQLPETYKSEKRMFVVIGIGVPMGSNRNYTTDPYCVWLNTEEHLKHVQGIIEGKI